MNQLLSIHFDLSGITGFSLVVAFVGYTIVFSALVILFYIYNSIPKIINSKIRQKLKREGKHVSESDDMNISGEVNAAISMALYLYLNELHDEESNVITIKRVSKQYSPWSSKIYGLNNVNVGKH